MTFVPIVPTPAQPPSPRTRELATLLSRVIEEYEKHHPSLSDTEISQALRVARQAHRGSSSTSTLLVTLLAGLMLFAGVAVFFYGRQGGGFDGSEGIPMIAVLIVIFSILGVAIAIKKAVDG